MKVILTFICTSIALGVFSQHYAGSEKVEINQTKVAGCIPPSTSTYMELNNVRALIHTAGNLWQIPGQNLAMYEVPKNSGIMALFTSALWLGGVDANNQLKLAALRYRSGQDYWTGPLTEVSAETTFENCQKYDKHFITTQDAVREFDAWFQAGIDDAQNGTNTQSTLFAEYEVPEMIKEWPAHGDVSQGQDFYLAPFFDRNEDGIYNWEDGDYPWYDIHKKKDCTTERGVSLYGDLNYWWVMNDKGNIHTETGSDPIGMEIRAQAFTFASNDEVNNMTFYNYELINRGSQTLFDTYFGCFTDGALGDPQDDYVGCDVNRGLAYYYNGDNLDEDNGGWFGYGENPPAVGVDFFEGPYQDNDGIDNAFGIDDGEALNGIGYGDGIIDNERYGMRRFCYYSNTTNGAHESQTDPIVATDYYRYMKGFWKDGTRFFYGGSGHLSDPSADASVTADFMFPGDTDPLGWGTGGIPQQPWTEQTAGNQPNDRRFVQSAGPFVLKPGAVNNITVGVVWARSNSGDPFASVEVLKRADDKAQALFENCFRVLDAPHAPELKIQELENELILTLENPINSNNYLNNYIEFDPFIAADPNADKYYRFQGYQIYQVSGSDVSAADLDDESKARLVAQCDIEDDIDRIINFEYDDIVGGSIPIEYVDGENKGVQHSFRVTEDMFAQGERKLVNFKRYHYIAVAYAHNNYKHYDPNDPNALDGQKKRYISSRKSPTGEIKVVEAIPHHPAPEAGGTLSNIAYGFGPKIKRLDGFGNGGNIVDLTPETTQRILESGYVSQPVFANSAGPINVKVVDPLNVKGGYYECLFNEYDASNFNGADTASWTINRYDKEGGTLEETITSDMAIGAVNQNPDPTDPVITGSNNEQLIPQWGVSVTISQEPYEKVTRKNNSGVYLTVGYSSEILEATISYADSSKRWLMGVQDQDNFFPTNWIRSGDYDPLNGTAATDDDDCLDPNGPNYVSYFDPCNYPDELYWDTDKNFAKLLDGTIAPYRLTGYQTDYAPLAYYNGYDPTQVRNIASLSYLPSVDIVITADKSKWTRCPVIELGRNAALNVGGAQPGQLRKSPGVDKDGNADGSEEGMGWFPGYAIDVESGARLYMAFGENSFLKKDNGADMIWNPTERITDNPLNPFGAGNPIMGGMHPVYIFNYHSKDKNKNNQSTNFPYYDPSVAEGSGPGNVLFDEMMSAQSGSGTSRKLVFSNISWVAYPTLMPGQELLATDALVRLRMQKEYKNFSEPDNATGGPNGGKPMYSWNMDDILTQTGSADVLTNSVLDMINVVPNPYYAYSQYERNRLDTRIKITNLPEKCAIKIYSVNGKLVRSFKKDSPQTFLDWNLNNHKGIPVASGIYLIHVDLPGIGERVLKAYISMRQVDLQNI